MNTKQTISTQNLDQQPDDNVAFYSEKYHKTGKAGSFFINGFYNALEQVFKTIKKEITTACEVACGPGISTYHIIQFSDGIAMYASDIEEDLVKQTTLVNPTAITSKQSIYSTEYSDNQFELVYALEVLEHLDDPQKALQEISRISSKYAIISVPHEPIWRIMNLARGAYVSSLGNTTGHINHWGINGFKQLLKSQNMKIIKSAYPLPWQIHLVETNIS